MADMSKYTGTESNWLKAADMKGANIKGVIESVEVVHFEARDRSPAQDKPIISFVGREKKLVVNPSNCKILCAAYGNDSDHWVGHEIGLRTEEYEVGIGWVVTPLDVAPPSFDDDIPF